jgi:pimeloyl-ACP methyl ester carboxylesterase
MRHVIFIPGFYGTRLVQAADRRIVWLSARQALFGSKTAARTGFEVPGAMELDPSTVLDRIPVLPGIYSVDVFGGFLHELRDSLSTPGSQPHIHLFAYDWRDDYLVAVKKLARLITELTNKDAVSISIVAHSMGGLITSYYLRYGHQEPEQAVETWEGAAQIDKVVLATVPFKGSMTALRNMKHGAKFGLNTTLLKAQAFATFPSVYEMMPTYAPVLLDGELKPLSHTLFESDLWQQYGWGFWDNAIHATSVSEQTRQRRLAFVTAALRRGRRLYERMHSPLQRAPRLHTQMLYTFAASHATIARAVLINAEAAPTLIFHRDEFTKHFPTKRYRTLFEDGDETVSVPSAQLPSAFKQALAGLTEYQSQAGHAQIFNDREIRGRIFDFLNS